MASINSSTPRLVVMVPTYCTSGALEVGAGRWQVLVEQWEVLHDHGLRGRESLANVRSRHDEAVQNLPGELLDNVHCPGDCWPRPTGNPIPVVDGGRGVFAHIVKDALAVQLQRPSHRNQFRIVEVVHVSALA
jgi:hypothetical protein